MAAKSSNWTGDDFRAWRGRVGLTQAAAAGELGVTPLTVKLYEKGLCNQTGRPRRIPLYIELACTALEIGPMSILRRRSANAPDGEC